MFACGQTEVLRWVLQVSDSSIGRIQWQLPIPIPVALGIGYISVVCAQMTSWLRSIGKFGPEDVI